MRFVFVKLPMLILFQVRQGQIFKQQVKILIFRDLKNKLILAFAVLACLTLAAAATAATALRTFDTVVLHKVIVPRMYAVAQATAALVEHRFANIF